VAHPLSDQAACSTVSWQIEAPLALWNQDFSSLVIGSGRSACQRDLFHRSFIPPIANQFHLITFLADV
jgi:hypothetical protein